MTNNEAAKWIQLYIDLAKIDPTTGEAAYLNDDDKKIIEAMEMAINALTAQPEITEDDVKEYCRKRCLIVVTSDFYDEMMSRWSSAQPVDKDTNVLCTDTISRAEAIRVASGYCHPSNVAKELAKLPSVQPEPQWIPCSERMPEETESMFAKFYGTDKWRSSMMRKRSKRVIVTVEYPDGERRTDVASTSDGRWVDSVSVVKKKVIAWMPLPEPYAERRTDESD